MPKPVYCVSPTVPNCRECALSNYGRDCLNFPIPAEEDQDEDEEGEEEGEEEDGGKA